MAFLRVPLSAECRASGSPAGKRGPSAETVKEGLRSNQASPPAWRAYHCTRVGVSAYRFDVPMPSWPQKLNPQQ